MAWLVYIVRCRDGSLYTGTTPDLPARLAAHNAGKGARYTRSRRPVRLVFSERKRTRGAALSREWQLKQLTRVEKLALVKVHASARIGIGKVSRGASRRRQ